MRAAPYRDAIAIFQNIFHFICKYNSFVSANSRRHLRFKKRRRNHPLPAGLCLLSILDSLFCPVNPAKIASVQRHLARIGRPRSALLKSPYVPNERDSKAAKRHIEHGPRHSCRIFKIQRARGTGVRGRGGVSLRKGVAGGTSEPGNKAWGSESPTVLRASRNLGTPTSGFRTCFPVHRKRGGRSYARRRTRAR